MKNNTELRRGKQVADLLWRSWSDPRPPQIGESQLEDIAPVLLGTGAAGLAWRRVRHSGLRSAPAALELRQAYLMHTLRALEKELEIGRVFRELRSMGVEPLLFKGWAMARSYPERGLRPYGDIDLCVPSGKHPLASRILFGPDSSGSPVDLHQDLSKFGSRSLDELYGRSRLVPLGESEVRILGPEDHLRILCLHLLRHGVRRPLLLCDIGVLLDSTPEEFDWEYCLSGDKRRRDWVVSGLSLSHRLLGASLDRAPEEVRSRALPGWLTATVIKQWERPLDYQSPMMKHLLGLQGVAKGIRQRWPNGIEATVRLRGPFNGLPRLPFQASHLLLRMALFALRPFGRVASLLAFDRLRWGHAPSNVQLNSLCGTGSGPRPVWNGHMRVMPGDVAGPSLAGRACADWSALVRKGPGQPGRGRGGLAGTI